MFLTALAATLTDLTDVSLDFSDLTALFINTTLTRSPGIKHCASNVLYSLQHIGYTVAPQSDAGWIGEAGPGPTYGDEQPDGTRAGLANEFTNRNTTFMTWNLLHLARMLKTAGGFPDYGNQRKEWDAGARFDFVNPEYRS